MFLKRIIRMWGGGPTIKDGQTDKRNILCLIRDFSIFGWFYLGWPIIENAMDSELSARTTTFGPLLVVNNHRYKKYRLTLSQPSECGQQHTLISVYGIKCVGRIVTKSMSYFLHLCDCSVPYCASLQAWNLVGAGQHLHASHHRSSVWPIPNVILFSGNYF